MNKLCKICGGDENKQVYFGDIRDGAYGGVKGSAVITECNHCSVQWLNEESCIPHSYYETGEYRKKLQESLEGDQAFSEQDIMQFFTLETIFQNSLRNKTILDVGCGVGSLLDMIKGVSSKQIGIDPCSPYLESLASRGYEIYSSLSDASKLNAACIDYAFSIQVIEHVANPREFLEEIKKLIKPKGRLLISTPNRHDILMNLMKEEFPPFFYRTQHRWYFDENSLIKCSEIAGYKVERIHFVHRYGMANTLYWLRDKKPKGRKNIDGIDKMTDTFWKGYLENSKQSDTIFIELTV